MSSDRQRLVGAIRRIAGINPEDGERSAESSNRGSQPGSVGYGVTESTDRLCCDGSVSGNVNPGTNTRDSSDSAGGLDESDPADISGMGGGCLSGVTDCATSEPICFCGSGWVPPDGWDDAQTQPTDDDWELGYYWELGGVPDPSGSGTYTIYNESPYAILVQFASTETERLGREHEPYNFEQKTDPAEAFFRVRDIEIGSITTLSGNRYACGGGPEPGTTCSSEAPTKNVDWPDDGCVNLAVIGGKIVGSKYDPENDGSYSAPRDEIELCDGSNGSILIRGSAGGGWKSIASLQGDIDPDTDHGYLYSAYGDAIRQISPSEFRDDRV